MRALNLPVPERPGSPPTLCMRAPSIDDLRAVVRHRQTYGAYRNGVDGVAIGRGKQQRYQWCVAEAIRQKQRDFLSRAACVGIAQDARAHRMLVRIVAIDHKLNEMRFMLGVAKNYGSGHAAIKRTTKLIIDSMCIEEAGYK
eukprot:8352372-Pyramimonas_sp.AAC.1